MARASSWSTTAGPMSTAETRWWPMTVQGFRPVRTVTPPSTSCAGMPRKPTNLQRLHVLRALVRRQHEQDHDDGQQRVGQQPVAELDHIVDGADVRGARDPPRRATAVRDAVARLGRREP